MFGKKASKPQGHIDTLIGVDTCVQGDIEFSGGLRVDGHVRGNIIATGEKPSTLVLSEQATIEGKVQVSHAIINGTIIGPIHAYEYLELQAKARVSGDVHYRVIEIKFGAVVEGKLVNQGNSESDEKVVELLPAASD
ncbi:MAG: cell shape determination protein CcmA [Nitrosomonadaceae bacterium]|nr:cell shape determination protein CcmA [Nitrosomonadaceae bacterium]